MEHSNTNAARVRWRLVLSISLIVGAAIYVVEYARSPANSGPLRKLSPAVREKIVREWIEWDRRHSGWKSPKHGFASYSGNFAVTAGSGIARAHACAHVGFLILDASGQPIHDQETDFCSSEPWAMGWDEAERLWFVSESGEARYWEFHGGQWAEREYIAGQSPAVPEFD